MSSMKLIAASLLCVFGLVGTALAGQQGATETIFNRRFIPNIKPAMTYDQVVKLAGVPGVKIGEDVKVVPPSVQYRWQGGRDSILTVKFSGNKLVEATVLGPNKHTYLVRAGGEVVDITK
jgi:hypothetical protein